MTAIRLWICLLGATATVLLHGGHLESGPTARISKPNSPISVLKCSADLRREIEAAPDDVVLVLGSCSYFVDALARDGYNSGIRIHNKHNLTIKGVGQGLTTVTFGRSVYVGFELSGNTTGLAIQDMTIAGSVSRPLCQENPTLPKCYGEPSSNVPNTHGVAVLGQPNHISGVTLNNLEVKNLAVGLQVGYGYPCSKGNYANVTVNNNYIHDMHGIYGGSGYGIVSTCAENVIIENNVVEHTHRHAIYQSMTIFPNPSPITIVNNVVIDHGGQGERFGPQTSSIALARSNNVTAMGNTVIGGTSYGLSAEFDPALQMDCQKCILVGNKFVNSGRIPDIWINAHSPVRTFHNTRELGHRANVRDDTKNEVDLGRSGTFWRRLMQPLGRIFRHSAQ